MVKKTKTRAIIDFLFPGAFLLILLVCDIFLYPITKEQYILFGINMDLVAGMTLLFVFHLIPMVWIFILLHRRMVSSMKKIKLGERLHSVGSVIGILGILISCDPVTFFGLLLMMIGFGIEIYEDYALSRRENKFTEKARCSVVGCNNTGIALVPVGFREGALLCNRHKKLFNESHGKFNRIKE